MAELSFDHLFLDGVYLSGPNNPLRFLPVKAPTPVELIYLVEQISYRVGRHLERVPGEFQILARNILRIQDLHDHERLVGFPAHA